MTRCKESAGLLFPRKCENAASRRCVECGRDACETHLRDVGNRPLCVTCVRKEMRERKHRGTYVHLADDPHFYWYYHSSSWFDESLTAQDYALFDDAGVDFDAGFEHDWAGS